MIIVYEQKIDPELNLQIEKLREELIETGLSKGFNNPETIQLSQQLDKLLNDVFIR
ncbi:aspartyl-phosphate phosphatase Spo0E family protein [Schinkia azotoformans]|uniref:aspartyl-phosphate phosphatase Spo0E family protein n=1 Tax=Schinkia azotoformans TaxID=1454 RepID=UPI002DB68E9F|nr:aspartyl-phosphate phosphatase Spo0E family protein [Schinkia azotoformans]MEC1768298.1 aspartyl-phosphate phosphatase Spo0E family protein [Schinkia azotoformans]